MASSSNSSSLNYTCELLTLPKSDLIRSNPTLVLTTVPFETLMTGKILANSKSASLVTPTHSYGFTTIGTSNTLVVWEPKEETLSSPPNKKLKRQCVPQPCRLIHPGGSGASFLSHEETHLEAHQVLPLLPRSTSALALLLQHSERQVETVLSTMTVIMHSTNNDWHSLPEDDVWQAQAAVVQTLCEEEEEDNDDMESKVAQRLASSGFDSSTATAMARQFWKLACQGGVVVHCETIAVWALHDLFRQQPSWTVDDLLPTWQSRLPFGSQWETLVGMEFLQQQNHHHHLQVVGDTVSVVR